jgi:hypothetical protein
MNNVVEAIKGHHRRRRYAMKVQQKIDRALESFIRINATKWTYDAAEADREKFNREVAKIIASARKGDGDKLIVELVQKTDRGREPFDAIRKAAESAMEKLTEHLPVAEWIKGVRGAGALGLATIVAEAGDLANYPNPAKLWKRLGFAPYDGHAGSSWKRQTWRPRTLTAEEWIANPFSGERYALMHQIIVWLVNAQWIGKAKTESGEGEPNGPYGEIYAARRKHTMQTHPDWTDGHRRMDALRVTMKAFLKDLHVEWRNPRAPVEEKPNRKRTTKSAQIEARP